MVFTRQKSRADANPESLRRSQSEINIREVRTPNQIVFTQVNNNLFVQQVVQYSQGKGYCRFSYHPLLKTNSN